MEYFSENREYFAKEILASKTNDIKKSDLTTVYSISKNDSDLFTVYNAYTKKAKQYNDIECKALLENLVGKENGEKLHKTISNVKNKNINITASMHNCKTASTIEPWKVVSVEGTDYIVSCIDTDDLDELKKIAKQANVKVKVLDTDYSIIIKAKDLFEISNMLKALSEYSKVKPENIYQNMQDNTISLDMSDVMDEDSLKNELVEVMASKQVNITKNAIQVMSKIQNFRGAILPLDDEAIKILNNIKEDDTRVGFGITDIHESGEVFNIDISAETEEQAKKYFDNILKLNHLSKENINIIYPTSTLPENGFYIEQDFKDIGEQDSNSFKDALEKESETVVIKTSDPRIEDTLKETLNEKNIPVEENKDGIKLSFKDPATFGLFGLFTEITNKLVDAGKQYGVDTKSESFITSIKDWLNNNTEIKKEKNEDKKVPEGETNENDVTLNHSNYEHDSDRMSTPSSEDYSYNKANKLENIKKEAGTILGPGIPDGTGPMCNTNRLPEGFSFGESYEGPEFWEEDKPKPEGFIIVVLDDKDNMNLDKYFSVDNVKLAHKYAKAKKFKHKILDVKNKKYVEASSVYTSDDGSKIVPSSSVGVKDEDVNKPKEVVTDDGTKLTRKEITDA